MEGHHCRPHVECSALKQLEDTIEPSEATAHILEPWPSAIPESQNTSLPPNIRGNILTVVMNKMSKML